MKIDLSEIKHKTELKNIKSQVKAKVDTNNHKRKKVKKQQIKSTKENIVPVSEVNQCTNKMPPFKSPL